LHFAKLTNSNVWKYFLSQDKSEGSERGKEGEKENYVF